MAHLVLGLGNPGPEYADTRHNVGFRVIEELARRRGLALGHSECNALLATDEASGLLLAEPQTYMNRSGFAARCLLERYQLDPAAVLVVYDEINLPLGKLRLRKSGSPAGHRGIESVIESLRTDEVPRLRLGVAPEGGPPAGEDWAGFVLGPFAAGEREALDAMILRAADACEAWLRDGIDTAMNRFNGQGG
jgi:peptidyl-tRNA hydrolase, PTH1 family